MKYIFTLQNNIIGKKNILDVTDDYDYEDEKLMLFIWLEGNMACDCNRRILIYKKYNFHNSKCGFNIKLLKITNIEGKIIYEKDIEGLEYGTLMLIKNYEILRKDFNNLSLNQRYIIIENGIIIKDYF